MIRGTLNAVGGLPSNASRSARTLASRCAGASVKCWSSSASSSHAGVERRRNTGSLAACNGTASRRHVKDIVRTALPQQRQLHSVPASSSAAEGSPGSMLAGVLRSAVQDNAVNGILGSDDYFVKGVPRSQYSLRDLFDVTQSLGADPDGKVGQSTPDGFRHEGTTATASTANVCPSLLKSVFAQHRHINPFSLVEKDLTSVSESIRGIVGSDHPVLERVASYFFDVKGKRVRPTIVLLMAHALSLSRSDVTAEQLQQQITYVTREQKRLSEITEMFHTASLLHDDVLDEALERRGAKSVNAVFGNKLAILGGDFLLARSSMALAKLQSPKVIEIMSTIIEHLVKGEIMQMRSRDNNTSAVVNDVNRYITKSFYKSASIIQHSCWACAVIAGHSEKAQVAAREYGKFLGLAFQIVDDLLDFVGEADVVGKPIHNDLQQGLVTLPVIYAAQAFPQEMNTLITRRFKDIGDVEMAIGLVERSNAIQKARDLAIACGDAAVAAALQLPPSKARSALVSLVEIVLERDH